MKYITYSLLDEKNNSEEFYNTLENFTNRFIEDITRTHIDIINKYKEFLTNRKDDIDAEKTSESLEGQLFTLKDKVLEFNPMECENHKISKKFRSNSEYLLDFIALGVFWNNYISYAVSFDDSYRGVFKRLIKARKKGGILKAIADSLRGILSTVFLNKRSLVGIETSMNNLYKLIEWLNAAGEFTYEVRNFKTWLEYLSSIPEDEAIEIMNRAIKAAAHFNWESYKVLGKYTGNVEAFLKGHSKKYNLREDYIFCGRKRNEYHLNMFGAEILNKAYREEFLKTRERLLLLPACMRIKAKGDCGAEKTPNGFKCVKCSSNCEVSKLSKLGEKNNFKVYIIPHESDAFKEKDTVKDVGIIGVACVLNLIEGGLKANEMGFVPQCVFLDYCGCSNHWDNDGIATSINTNKLIKILKE